MPWGLLYILQTGWVALPLAGGEVGEETTPDNLTRVCLGRPWWWGFRITECQRLGLTQSITDDGRPILPCIALPLRVMILEEF